jgi:hypothetical protein
MGPTRVYCVTISRRATLVEARLRLAIFMGIIAVLPGLIAAYIAWRRSAQIALLDVYLPVLLLLPEYYRWVVPALPDPTFSQATILPIAAVFFLREFRHWRYSWNDGLVLAFAACIGYSEYINTGYKEAQNLMFDMVASVVLPYMMAKGLIEPKGMRVAFARRFAWLLFVVSVVSIFEFRMGMTPWQMVLNRFFPGQGEGWITTFRYGFARIAGPYGHAILAGLILVIGYRIQRWLEWTGNWEPRFKKLPWLKISKARVITLGIALGVAMTLVRGPWLGGFVGAILTAVGFAKKRKLALILVGSVVIAVGVPAASMFYAYASVGRANAKSDSQETAAYRLELIDKYINIALQKGTLGWGRNTWPKVDGMTSIDNYYLLLALMHGFVGDALLVLILLGTIFRLVRFEMQRPPPRIRGASFGFTLAGIFLAFGVTIATVYVGLTAMPVFALMTGWAEGYLLNTAPAAVGARVAVATVATPKFAFRRVVA